MLTEAQRKANLEAEEYLKNLELEFSFGCIKVSVTFYFCLTS